MNKLFTTNFGNQAWKMDHAGSDNDLFTAFLSPINDVLLGKIPAKSGRRVNGMDDEILHEIGKVCQFMKKVILIL